MLMNPSLIKTEYLATGQTAPFTGQWVNTALCKNGFIVVYASGSSVSIDLQAKTELNQNPMFLEGGSAEAVSFYTATGIGAGYGDPIFFDSPIAKIRLAATAGNAPVFAYITYQN
jgi:hypothetical protein